MGYFKFLIKWSCSGFFQASNSTTNHRESACTNGENSSIGRVLTQPMLRIFTFKELKNATRNFKIDSLIGEGGFGKVYKGMINDVDGTKSLVAVKQLNPASLQGIAEWKNEINFLGKFSHPNLVKLLGYCEKESQLLLVYEFEQRGSLYNHLFRAGSNMDALSWEVRINIAIGAARGFAFLHESADKVICRDIKSSNILLDTVYNAIISDFGLAKEGPAADQSHHSYGYQAPEYINTGNLYVKSDVYSFGVVLVELLTGLKAFDQRRPEEKIILTDWIKPLLSNERKLKTIVDKGVGKYPLEASTKMANLALACLAIDPQHRPSMREVLGTLEKIMNIGKTQITASKTTATQASRHVTENISK